MRLRQVISASIVIAGTATAGAQDFVVPLAAPFEPAAPYFDPAIPTVESAVPTFQSAMPYQEPYARAAAQVAPLPLLEVPPVGRNAYSLGAPPPQSPRVQSTVYVRLDYFHWSESIRGENFVTETGPLTTLGYMRQVGQHRLRGEFFGGAMDYSGFAQFSDGTLEPLSSVTNIIGLRGEYDLLYDPPWWQQATLLFGLGSRLWYRDM